MKLLITIFALICISSHAAEFRKKEVVVIDEKKVPIEFIAHTEDNPEREQIAKRMATVYFANYGKIIKFLGLPSEGTPRTTIVAFHEDLRHPAHATGNTININLTHLRKDPSDTEGLFVHELSHVIQSFRPGAPSWFVEGSADYIRFKVFPDSHWAKVNREHLTDKNQPFGHYWKSTAFLLWMEETYAKPVIKEVSKLGRSGDYNDAIWKKLTGKDLNELAAEYAESTWEPPLK